MKMHSCRIRDDFFSPNLNIEPETNAAILCGLIDKASPGQNSEKTIAKQFKWILQILVCTNEFFCLLSCFLMKNDFKSPRRSGE